MASGKVIEGGKDGEREKQRYKEYKVYTRKVFKGSKNNFLDNAAVNNTAITTTTAANKEENSIDKKNGENDNSNSAEAPVRHLPVEFGDSINQQLSPRVDTAVSDNSAEAPAQPLRLEFGDSTTNQQPAPCVNTAVSGNSTEAAAQPLPLEFGDSTNQEPAPRVDNAVLDNSAEAPDQPLPLEFGDSTNQQTASAPHIDTAVSGNSTEAPGQPLPLDFGDSTNQQPAPPVDTTVSNSTEALGQPLPLDFGNSTNEQPAPRVDTAVSDDTPVLKRQQVVADGRAVDPGSQNQRKIGMALRTKQENRELRRKLESELNLVRNLVKRIEAKEEQTNGFSNTSVPFNGCVDFRFNGVQSEVASVGIYEEPIVKQSRPLNQLNISVLGNGQGANGSLEKEKRTPKANQFYRNSEFLLAKDKFPAAESNKKSKSTVKKLGGGGFTDSFGTGNKFFKNCSTLLERLMKHKHGWVFNTPVDVKGLGLHDYYTIIKNPMDLGTVKSRLNQNWYKSPREFAEDVRLTFSNAMTYNPKGQDVHVMAEQLSQIFEDKWDAIEADWFRDMRVGIEYEVGLPMPTPRTPHPVRPPPLDMRRILDRQESMVHPVDLRPKLVATTPSSRTPTLKKPKAKDLYKRDMTYEEKQKLSTNLLSLPSEKLDNIVHIIKKSNSALLQHDDEIEVDIDSVDNDTLWELDRFYTNYKKNMSKHKRKAELALQARVEPEQTLTKRTPAPVLLEVPKEATTKEQNVSTSPVRMEKQGNDASRSSSSSSSSSDSGSSSSDSDSGSSSSSGSDAGHSPRS